MMRGVLPERVTIALQSARKNAGKERQRMNAPSRDAPTVAATEVIRPRKALSKKP
jgi:hypothetical protein